MRYCWVRNPNPLFRNCSDKFFVFRNGKTCPVAHLPLDTGALKTTEGKAEVPSLDKEGWLRPLRKSSEASLAGADGHERSECEPDRAKQGRVVRSSHRFIGSGTNHPVRASQRNGTIYWMARPPLLCQGVSRAVLLASSITERKSAARKQRTYRPTSLRGEFGLTCCLRQPVGGETRNSRCMFRSIEKSSA